MASSPQDQPPPPSQPTSTQITPEHLTQLLKSHLSASHVHITDISGGCGSSFNAEIVSDNFATCRTSLARHRMVNAAIREELKTIHAWTAKLYTVEEWEKREGRKG